MSGRFLAALLVSFALTLGLLGGAGWAASQFAAAPAREVFRTPYFEFELAAGWKCHRNGVDHICRPTTGTPKAALVLLSMKERNKDDTLDAYREHLEKPKMRRVDEGEAAAPSAVRYVRRRTFGDREWVEGLHAGSEVRNYDTYYLATVTSLVAILLTLSVHEKHADEYIEQIRSMVATVRSHQR